MIKLMNKKYVLQYYMQNEYLYRDNYLNINQLDEDIRQYYTIIHRYLMNMIKYDKDVKEFCIQNRKKRTKYNFAYFGNFAEKEDRYNYHIIKQLYSVEQTQYQGVTQTGIFFYFWASKNHLILKTPFSKITLFKNEIFHSR